MRPRQVIITLEDLFAKQTGSLRRKGQDLHDLDSQTVQEVYQQWLLLLLDLGYLPLEDVHREWGRMVKHMFEQDVLTLINASAECLQIVYNQFSDGTKGFKALCHVISPNLFSIIKADVHEVITQDNVIAAKRLIQFFAFPTRLSLRYVDLADQCLNDYKSTEDAFTDYLPKGIIRSLNAIMRRWLADLDLRDLSYGHGNGSTAGSIRNLEHKYRSLCSDKYLDIVYKQDFLPEIHLSDTQIWDQPIRCKLERISQTTFVPKNYKTFRTISMEPATLMFIQQGILRRLDNYIERHSYLRPRIGLHDQQRNRALAAEGSFSRSYCTIDLSAASDSVSWKLVKAIFDKTPIMKHLIATRSKQTLLPNGEIINLKKFAPMGSAMSFPVETLIFAACCEFVTREHGRHLIYSVFGDDIIVPTECYEDMHYILTLLGFTINTDKSFYDSSCWFRESCGGEFCDGYDVTPLRISRRYHHENDDIALAGLVDTANRAYKKGFSYLRSFLIGKLQRSERFIPYFSETSILGDSYSNYHTKRRWNFDLQTIDCFVTCNKVSYEPRDERIAYLHALVLMKQEDRVNEDDPWREFDPIPSWDDSASRYETGQMSVDTRRSWVRKPYDENDDEFIAYCRELTCLD